MPDANGTAVDIRPDAPPSLKLPPAALHLCRDAKARLKVTAAAVERGKRKFGTESVDDLAVKLGYTRLAFYRLRTGRGCRISIEEAAALANKLDLSFTRTFERAA
jgi:hypothetical protein